MLDPAAQPLNSCAYTLTVPYATTPAAFGSSRPRLRSSLLSRIPLLAHGLHSSWQTVGESKSVPRSLPLRSARFKTLGCNSASLPSVPPMGGRQRHWPLRVRRSLLAGLRSRMNSRRSSRQSSFIAHSQFGRGIHTIAGISCLQHEDSVFSGSLSPCLNYLNQKHRPPHRLRRTTRDVDWC